MAVLDQFPALLEVQTAGNKAMSTPRSTVLDAAVASVIAAELAPVSVIAISRLGALDASDVVA
jgi:hypothetical protein